MMQRTKKNAMPSMMKGVEVLEFVLNSNEYIYLSHLTQKLNIPRATAYRLTVALHELGFLAKEPGSKKIVPGPRLRNLGYAILQSSSNIASQRAVLRKVTIKTGETCSLAVLDGDEALLLERVESDSPLRLQLFPGSRVPLHCTSSGKLFLANLRTEKREELLKLIELQKFTQNTITQKTKLQTELALIRKLGYSEDQEEYLDGLRGIAVPVKGENGKVVASVSLNAPTARFKTIEKKEIFVQSLREAAKELGQIFDRNLNN